jgi:hypothetical protein
MRRFHLFIGAIGVIAFLATGVSMRWHEPPMVTLNDATRLLMRSRHVYLLLASLLNLSLGLYATAAVGVVRRCLQTSGSLLVLAGPPALLGAFVREPLGQHLGGSLTTWSVIGLFAGTLCHALARLQPLRAAHN